MPKIARARVVPYSSIVGSSVLLLDGDGRSICQLGVIGAADPREVAEAVAGILNAALRADPGADPEPEAGTP